jgi:hypothetical protein
VRRDREPQDAVAEERETRVRVTAAIGPRSVGEDLLAQVIREIVEQLSELLQGG